MGYCHFVNVKRIQDLASAGFFAICNGKVSFGE
nr:MAG TPA_asm: hypothetical protein [Caudoviricetes sp.]